jgi:predicted acylesterase/phospholipase RssA
MSKANSQPGVKEADTGQTKDIGRADTTLRVFAFASGGFDAVMQLGTIHALMISGESADIALGISAGAINAVALGEILKIAPDAAATQFKGKDLALKKEAAAVGRFLEILEAYCEVPIELLRSIRPDLHEVVSGSAFKPLELPIHFKKERDSRAESLREKSGLVRFLNGVFDCQLPVGTLTRFVRLALDYIATGDQSQRWARQLWVLIRMWLEALGAIATLSPSIGLSLWAISGVPSFDLGGVEAKTIIFRKHWPRLRYAIQWLLGALAILTAPLLGLFAYVVIRLKKVDNANLSFIKNLADHFLEFFCLKAELGDSYALEQSFVKFFDRDYYGKFSMDEALAAGLSENRNRPQDPHESEKKKLSNFAQCDRENGLFPIHVVPVAAKLEDCKLHYFPAETPVIDALMASTALVPFFRAREVKGEFYIDGANVSNEPIREAMRFLQKNHKRIADHISKIIVYSVTPFPIKGAVKALDEEGKVKIYNRVVDIGLRASALAQLRDAELEQKLMKLYNKVLPEKEVTWQEQDKGTTYVCAEPVPIATEAPLDLNEHIPAARSAKERRELIAAGVADGCRLSLEQFIAKDPTFVGHIRHKWQINENRTISCSTVIRSLREANVQLQTVPKTNGDKGPGIAEICRACRGKRSEGISGVQLQVPEYWTGVEATTRPCAFASADQTSPNKTLPDKSLEESRSAIRGSDKAQVALLFSGGVFRGVFQVGVANALALVLDRPQIVAGASVGSITASLVAQLFCEKSDNDRKVQIRRLAATYLTLDRFVLTDRLADFVRRFTVRAGNANFSIRDIDLVLRRFEAAEPRKFNDCVRRVAAGFERLFYLSPFALLALVRDLRLGRRDRVWLQVQDYIQEMLERYGVGLEILGPEPLSLLLREHVLRRNQLPGTPGKTYADLPEIASFDFFREQGIEFLATVTNLTEGKLDVLDASGEAKPRFVDGLLASSAFPALFRPRWSWEVFMTQSPPVQFSDGGMLDNLPFYPVVDFIKNRHSPGAEPPTIPHLIFTASLETEPKIWDQQHSKEWKKAFATSWLSVRSRAKEMKFNKKIEDFVHAQREVRSIFEARYKEGIQFPPLSIEVLVVKPQWLCGTFAFHPMLGYRRDLQAANIAHGCYQTLQAVREFPDKFADGVKRTPEQKKMTERALDDWGFKRGLLDSFTPASKAEKRGQCWYYPNITCPFSEKTGIDVRINEELRMPLDKIYRLCGEQRTHKPHPSPADSRFQNER